MFFCSSVDLQVLNAVLNFAHFLPSIVRRPRSPKAQTLVMVGCMFDAWYIVDACPTSS